MLYIFLLYSCRKNKEFIRNAANTAERTAYNFHISKNIAENPNSTMSLFRKSSKKKCFLFLISQHFESNKLLSLLLYRNLLFKSPICELASFMLFFRKYDSE